MAAEASDPALVPTGEGSPHPQPANGVTAQGEGRRRRRRRRGRRTLERRPGSESAADLASANAERGGFENAEGAEASVATPDEMFPDAGVVSADEDAGYDDDIVDDNDAADDDLAAESGGGPKTGGSGPDQQ